MVARKLTWRRRALARLVNGLGAAFETSLLACIPLSYLILSHKAFSMWRVDRASLYRLLRTWLPLVLVITFLLILPQKIIYPLSQGDYAARILEMREQRARPDIRPSSTVDRGYLLRDKGIPFRQVWASPVWWRMSYQSFYGYFGYWNVQAPRFAYFAAPILLLLGIAFTYVDFMRRRTAYSTLTRILLVVAPLLSLAILFASLYYSWIFDFQPQGRYLLPALLPLALLVGGAVDDEPRGLRGARVLMWILLLVLSFYTQWQLVLRPPTMT